MAAQCISCHRPGEVAPFSLLTFNDVRMRGRAIVEATRGRYMPPWKPLEGFGGPFSGERRLTPQQIETIARWVETDMPEGRPQDLPSSLAAGAQWRLGPPDLIVTIPEPYVLAGDGPDVFRNFVIPVPLREQKYVAAIEFKPGATHSVHHANLRFDETSDSRGLDEQDPAAGYDGGVSMSARYPDGYLLGWTPGQSPQVSARGMPWRLAPGADAVVQLHMRRTGKAEQVRPVIAFYFTPDAPVRTPLALRLGRQNIDIAAGDTYTVTDSYQLPVDIEVHAVHPHAHYRARQIRATADLPDGTRRWLIRIDDWDFNWQDVYRFVTPLDLPKSTTITMAYTYDNSATNVRNPDRPPRRVIFGQNSGDEMGDLWLQVVARTEEDRAALYQHLLPKTLAEDAVGYEMLVAASPDHAGYRNDLARVNASLGRYDQAIEQFQSAVRLKPDWAAVRYNLATLLGAMGRLDEAVGHFRTAVVLRPDHAESYNNLGVMLQAQGHVAEAIAQFRRAVALDPENAQAQDNLARAVADKR